MATPGGGQQTSAIILGLCFASAIALSFVLLRRLRSNGRSNEETPPLEEENLVSVSEAAERFEEAREAVEVAAKGLPNASLLQLYAAVSTAGAAGLFKQATQGDCEQKEPSAFSLQAHSKWAAWEACRGLSRDLARAKYVQLAVQLKLMPQQGGGKAASGRKSGTGFGPVQSRPTLSAEETDNAGSKGDGFCCLVAEGDFDSVHAALSEDPSLVHERGEGGMTALHFAADRGFADIARMLIAKGALVNLQDECGETALHVAIAAEQQELISLLLEAGTDTSLKNNEGKSCDELLKEAENRMTGLVSNGSQWLQQNNSEAFACTYRARER